MSKMVRGGQTSDMNVRFMRTEELIPYERNQKKHDEKQIRNVANSIKRFGWQQPIVIDAKSVIVIGHCRWEAAKMLGLETVPVVCADNLTEDEIRELRIVDNKTNESPWDMEALSIDVKELDFDGFDIDFGFSLQEDDERKKFDDWNSNRDEYNERSETDEEYNEFLEKFEAKKTTDDCYTPEIVYNAVADYVAKRYKVSKDRFVRPFYPGGNYQKYDYKKDSIVVDNPPFSILSEITTWYKEHEIHFFLFAPALTLFSSSSSSSACAIALNAPVTYENGAVVSTSFLTSMEAETRFKSDPELYNVITEADEKHRKEMKKELPKYSYPDEVVTSSMVGKYSRYGIEFSASIKETEKVGTLDAQKKEGKGIFGNGYFVSRQKAAERAAAERAAAERAAAERAAAERAAALKFELSDREKAIVERLSQ